MFRTLFVGQCDLLYHPPKEIKFSCSLNPGRGAPLVADAIKHSIIYKTYNRDLSQTGDRLQVEKLLSGRPANTGFL